MSEGKAPEKVFRLRTVEGEVFYFDGFYIEPTEDSDAVEYIRKDKADEMIQQVMWQYAGVRM